MMETNAEPWLPTFDELIGREEIRAQLAARVRAHWNGEARFPHTLMVGPPGIGKSTLAAATIHALDAPSSAVHSTQLKGRAGRRIIEVLKPDNALFIDDSDFLDPRMQRFIARRLDASGPVLVATVLSQRVLVPEFRRKFGLVLKLKSYGKDDLIRIVQQRASHHGFAVSKKIAREIAGRARGVARRAIADLRRWKGNPSLRLGVLGG